MAKPILTAARLRELLHYDPETGEFRWLIGRGCARAGDAAGSPMKSGYIHFGVDGKIYYAHRLAWLYMTGEWPPSGLIDHINMRKADNRFENLRDVTRSGNGENKRTALKNNGSGHLGAFLAHDGQWTSKIVVKGQRHYLGRFKTAQEAHDAYVAAKRLLHAANTL